MDEVTGEHVLHSEIDLDEAGEPALTHHDAIGLVSGHAIVETLRIHPDDPLSARCSVRHCVLTRRAEWITRVETRLDFSADAAGFRLQARLEAREGGERVFERSWDEQIPLAPLEAPAHADPAAP